MGNFENSLRNLINSYNKENESNTPDFILSRYIEECLAAFTKATNERERWFGRLAADEDEDTAKYPWNEAV